MLGRFPCLHEINDILQDSSLLKAALAKIEERLSKGEIPLDRVERAKSVINHFKGKYLNQPEEQLGGVKSTIHNYLNYFGTPDVVEVFGQPAGNTVEFSDIDKGKIFCISMPQKYQIERRYVGSLLIVLFLQHAKRRFDALADQRKNSNLLILWADEGQRFLSGREDADILREAGAAIVASTQMHEGFYPTMRREVADVFIGNLSNRVIFRPASSQSAEASAQRAVHLWARKPKLTSYRLLLAVGIALFIFAILVACLTFLGSANARDSFNEGPISRGRDVVIGANSEVTVDG
jgi:hypothetical protein